MSYRDFSPTTPSLVSTHNLTMGDYQAQASSSVRSSNPMGIGEDEMVKKSMKEVPVKMPKKRKIVVRVVNSPKGHRVKLVGDNLIELAPLFVRWADRLEKDLRVVATGGEAAYQFYGRPMVAERVGRDGLCLFLTGSMKSEIRKDGAKWRVGLDEMAALQAPSRLDSPEFPAFANIYDEKKVFIGRVEGKMIYTMLYVPERAIQNTAPPDRLLEKNPVSYEPDPVAMEPFVEHVLSSYEKLMQTHAVEVYGGLTEVSFREFCGDSKRKRQRTIQETIDRASREIREIEASLTRKAREMREAQKDLTLTMSGAVDKEMAGQARKLGDLVEKGLYSSFKVRHGFLVGMTTPIVIEHAGSKFDLGRFMVAIKKDGSLKIEHESKAPPYHPHIHKDTDALCLGSFRNDVPKLIGLERYAMVYQVLYEFLGSYNPNDKYNQIEVCVGLKAAPTADGVGIGNPAQQPDERSQALVDMNAIIHMNQEAGERAIGIHGGLIVRSDETQSDSGTTPTTMNEIRREAF